MNKMSYSFLCLVTLVFIFFAIHSLHIPDHQKIFLYVIAIVAAAMLIIFQPLPLTSQVSSDLHKTNLDSIEFDRFLNSIAKTIFQLSEERIGALVVLENQNPLDEFANKAVILNAKFTPELLASIVAKTSPLHNGAVIIRETTILSAATILPLTNEILHLESPLGTRHRAGLGFSQITDAVVIVVSEENGDVAIAYDGIMVRRVRFDRFKGIVRSNFFPELSK